MYFIEKFFIGAGNGLVPNKRQAIARINYDPVNSDLDELNIKQVWTMLHILPPAARSYAYRLFCEYLRVNDLSNSHIGNIYMSVDIDISPDISFGKSYCLLHSVQNLSKANEVVSSWHRIFLNKVSNCRPISRNIITY